MVNKSLKKCLSSLDIMEMQIKTTSSYPNQNGKDQQQIKLKINPEGTWEKRMFIHSW